MEFEPLSLEHQPLFDAVLKGRALESADATFVNLWLWRFSRQIEVASAAGFLCVRLTYGDRPPVMLMPEGEGDLPALLAQLEQTFQKQGHRLGFRALSETMIEKLENARPGAFEFTLTPEHDDYLYDAEALIELKGRVYHAKKNFVNRFATTYGIHYERLNDTNLEESIGFVEEWFERAPYKAEAEERGIVEMLREYRRFECSYGILRAENKIAGLTIGEALSSDRVVIHVEKADGANYPGSYQTLNQTHLERDWPRMKIVNREEDLGLEGLKKAKLSYHPVGFVKKYEAVLKP